MKGDNRLVLSGWLIVRLVVLFASGMALGISLTCAFGG